MGVPRYYVQAMRPSGKRSRPIESAPAVEILGRISRRAPKSAEPCGNTRLREVYHERTICRRVRQSLFCARLVHHRYP